MPFVYLFGTSLSYCYDGASVNGRERKNCTVFESQWIFFLILLFLANGGNIFSAVLGKTLGFFLSFTPAPSYIVLLIDHMFVTISI